MCRLKDNLQELVTSFYDMGHRGQTEGHQACLQETLSTEPSRWLSEMNF